MAVAATSAADEESITPTRILGELLGLPPYVPLPSYADYNRAKKIQQRNQQQPEQNALRERAVLFSTGSFNPVHRGHLYQFEMARKFLAEKHKLLATINTRSL